MVCWPVGAGSTARSLPQQGAPEHSFGSWTVIPCSSPASACADDLSPGPSFQIRMSSVFCAQNAFFPIFTTANSTKAHMGTSIPAITPTYDAIAAAIKDTIAICDFEPALLSSALIEAYFLSPVQTRMYISFFTARQYRFLLSFV
jgi:hypothetical protein